MHDYLLLLYLVLGIWVFGFGIDFLVIRVGCLGSDPFFGSVGVMSSSGRFLYFYKT